MRQKVFSSARCWYHLAPRERQHLRSVLEDDTKPPDGPNIGAQQGDAIPHATVRRIVSARAVGAWLRIDLHCRELCWPRCVTVAQVTATGTATRPTKIRIAARFCRRCEEWHTVDSTEESVIPSPVAAYFDIREPTSAECDMSHLSPDCDDGDIGSDISEQEDVAPNGDAATEMKQWLDDPVRQPLMAATPHGSTNAGTIRADTLRSWYIHSDRPPHVHRIAWSSLSEATRKEHIRWLMRIKSAPIEIARMPLPRAVVELVLQMAAEREWRWSTISSKLSTAKSALANAAIYTYRDAGVDIATDKYFAATQQLAQKRARVEATKPQRSRPLSYAEFEAVKRKAHHGLTALTWWLAARTGDVRRIAPENILIDFEDVDTHNFVGVRALFTQGKGAHFWGPYSIHSRMPLPDAKAVAELVREAKQQRRDTLATRSQQDTVSRAVAPLGDTSLRSLRRGALQFFASAGTSDSSLQLLSGHQRRDTLLRYLEWGLESSEATRAAHERTALVAERVSGGEADSVPAARHPLWMGKHSGFHGNVGRRVTQPPRLFSHHAPSRSDVLGNTHEDTRDWHLHVKPALLPLDTSKAIDLVEATDLKEALQRGLAFLDDERLLGATWAPLAPKQLPKTTFTVDDWQKMHAAHKVIPLRVAVNGMDVIPITEQGAGTPFAIRSACRGHRVPQPKKKRWRPVFEPLTNKTADVSAYPPLRYPHRQQRRSALANAKFALEFDFAAWYDQVAIGLMDHFVCRANETISIKVGDATEAFEYFALTRIPMGASFSAHVMQTLTWCILEPILKASHTGDGTFGAKTMIDNVMLFASDADTFVWMVQTFLERCQQFGAVLNDLDDIPTQRDDIIAAGRTEDRPFTFLGEQYLNGTVANTPTHIENVRLGFRRLQQTLEGPTTVTRRQMASLIGLAVWMSHTIELPIRDYFEVVRIFSRLAQDASTDCQWDTPHAPTAASINFIGELIGPLLENVPVVPTSFPALDVDVFDNNNYDAVIVVDASATGLGAYVQFPATGGVVECRRGWHTHTAFSAWAEPRAATEMIKLIRSQGGQRVAVVSDHIALAQGQRRPESGNAGFSKAWYLNEFFRELYHVPGAHEVFFVEGTKNPADAPSRTTMVGDTQWHIAQSTMTFPSLASFYHPYAKRDDTRLWWHA
jgi:hypothetical protein